MSEWVPFLSVPTQVTCEKDFQRSVCLFAPFSLGKSTSIMCKKRFNSRWNITDLQRQTENAALDTQKGEKIGFLTVQ